MNNFFHNQRFHLALVLVAGIFVGWLLFRGNHPVPGAHQDQSTQENAVWTCSMHPQIRQGDPGQCPICGMDLIPVSRKAGANADASPFVYTMSAQAAALANIQTITVQSTSSAHAIRVSGKIAINEKSLTSVSANYPGRIETLLVTYGGQKVRAGEKIATIYSPELVNAQTELLEVARYKQTNPALYEAAQEKLRLWKIPQAQIDEIEATGSVRTNFPVYATTAGVVSALNVSAGDYVQQGSALFTLVDLRSVWVHLDAYERDLAHMRIGDTVRFTLQSVPGREFNSTITFIDPFIDPLTRTATVRAQATNPGMILKPDMFVSARISSLPTSQKGALQVPRSAVLWTGKRSVVYVQVDNSEEPSFEMREILLGPAAGESFVVESGLTQGEAVVSNGVFALDGAAQLSGNYSMMNRPASKRLPVSQEFKNQLTHFFKEYLALKKALVESDFSTAKKQSALVQKAFGAIDMAGLSGQAHTEWMEQHKLLDAALKQLAAAKDSTAQRSHFSPLSNVLIEVIERFGVIDEIVYVAYCPMAFNNKGAYWLSSAPEIRNPYFGDAMLTCGEVKKEIRSLDSYQEAMSAQPTAPLEHQH